MIKISVKSKNGVAACRSKIHCKGTKTLLGETVSAIAALITAVCKNVPGLEPEKIAENAVKLYRDGKKDGVTISEANK